MKKRNSHLNLVGHFLKPDLHPAKQEAHIQVQVHSCTFILQAALMEEMQSLQRNGAKKKHICVNIILSRHHYS
jgi:hypothetical protein